MARSRQNGFASASEPVACGRGQGWGRCARTGLLLGGPLLGIAQQQARGMQLIADELLFDTAHVMHRNAGSALCAYPRLDSPTKQSTRLSMQGAQVTHHMKVILAGQLCNVAAAHRDGWHPMRRLIRQNFTSHRSLHDQCRAGKDASSLHEMRQQQSHPFPETEHQRRARLRRVWRAGDHKGSRKASSALPPDGIRQRERDVAPAEEGADAESPAPGSVRGEADGTPRTERPTEQSAPAPEQHQGAKQSIACRASVWVK